MSDAERRVRDAIVLCMEERVLFTDGRIEEPSKWTRAVMLADEVLPALARKDGYAKAWDPESVARRYRKLRKRRR